MIAAPARISEMALAILLAMPAAAAGEASAAGRDDGPRDLSGFTLLHPEGFPLNADPQIVSADASALRDEDMVLGVVLGDAARAYPVNYMNGPYNEVVNDTLAGQPIASTW
jgi:hypothetical protein